MVTILQYNILDVIIRRQLGQVFLAMLTQFTLASQSNQAEKVDQYQFPDDRDDH